MEQREKIWIYALVSMMITICSSGFGRMAYGILMPFMRDSLALSYQQAGMLATSTALGYLVMVLIVGIMVSKWGSKPLVVIGLTLSSIGSIILFTVDSFIISLVAMVILGVGTAFAYTPLVNIVVGWFPNNRGLMIGFLVGGMGLGTLIASLLTPIFNSWFDNDGWRFLWLLFGITTLITNLIALKIIKEPPAVLRKDKETNKSLIRDVYLQKGVMLVAIIYGLIGFAYLIPQSFFFSYILEEGVAENRASNIMALGGLMSIISGPVWGNISDRIGRKFALCMTISLGALSILLPVLLPIFTTFLFSQILWGFTYIGMLSLIQALSTEQTHPSYAPVALGYVTIFFASGQILGPGLAGLLTDKFGGISVALWLTIGLLIVALILSARLNTKQAKKYEKEKVSQASFR